MNDSFFAGAYGGDATNLAANSRLECKICWHVYDPVQGDEVWQIAPGTSFAKLPEHWTCPNCGTVKQDFLLIEE